MSIVPLAVVIGAPKLDAPPLTLAIDENSSMPPETLVLPENVFKPESSVVPAPDLVNVTEAPARTALAEEVPLVLLNV